MLPTTERSLLPSGTPAGDAAFLAPASDSQRHRQYRDKPFKLLQKQSRSGDDPKLAAAETADKRGSYKAPGRESYLCVLTMEAPSDEPPSSDGVSDGVWRSLMESGGVWRSLTTS